MRAVGLVLAAVTALLLGATVLGAGGCGSGGGGGPQPIVVNTLLDLADPLPHGTVTLRAALAQAPSGGTITFDRSLDGGTITLTRVGEAHTTLPGEVYDRTTGQFQGYAERDYGRSALHVPRSVTIDASSLPGGISIAWGGATEPARVLAVRGDLTMRSVTIASGFAQAAWIGGDQEYTLARGGGLAVWGTATLERCTIGGNRCSNEADPGHARDRGAYGGGIYANGLDLTDCVVSGNAAVGYGAGGGGIYSVGGADNEGGVGNDAFLTGCTVSGNRVTAQHAYGGGVFSLAGGPLNLSTLHLLDCTVARNLVEASTVDPPPLAEQFYYRGGGVYVGGGSLEVASCTVAQNEVRGHPATFGGSKKPNMGGGGIAATIGNAHVVENMDVRHSIVVGNTLNGAPSDVYTGSLLSFSSGGYNRIGALDFSQILVPIPVWESLCRKHYPKAGDLDGVDVVRPEDVLDLDHVVRHASVVSAGVAAGEGTVLWYPPGDLAKDAVPTATYTVDAVLGEYTVLLGAKDDFLVHVLDAVRTYYGDATIGSALAPSVLGATFTESPQGWPSDPLNKDWIAFWRSLDAELGASRGTVRLGDEFWGTMFPSGLGDGGIVLELWTVTTPVDPTAHDQRGRPRGSGPTASGDIGAIEE